MFDLVSTATTVSHSLFGVCAVCVLQAWTSRTRSSTSTLRCGATTPWRRSAKHRRSGLVGERHRRRWGTGRRQRGRKHTSPSGAVRASEARPDSLPVCAGRIRLAQSASVKDLAQFASVKVIFLHFCEITAISGIWAPQHNHVGATTWTTRLCTGSHCGGPAPLTTPSTITSPVHSLASKRAFSSPSASPPQAQTCQYCHSAESTNVSP